MLRVTILKQTSLIQKTRTCLPCAQHRFFSDVDRKRKAENAARLRALRGSNKEKMDKNQVDYRLQRSTSIPLKNLWGESSMNSPTTTPKEMPASFFDEIDVNTNKKAINSIASLFDDLDRKQQERKDAGISLFGSSSAPRSIFDAFPLTPKKPVNPNAYETECFDEYLEMLNTIVESDHYRKKAPKNPPDKEYLTPLLDWLRRDEGTCLYSLPTLNNAIEHGTKSVEAESLRKELGDQQRKFLSIVPLDERLLKLAKNTLVLVGNHCARHCKPLPLDVAWEKCKEAGILLNEAELNNYLFGSTQFSISSKRRRRGSLAANSILSILDTTSEEECESQVLCDVPEEIATFRDVLYEPTEQSLTVRVRSLVSKMQAKEAQALLDSSELTELRHRTYQPILKIFLDNNEMMDALLLFKKMQDTPTCKIEPETYVQVIASLAEHGHFQAGATAIAGIDKIGYSPSSGPVLFDQILTAMADDVLEITSASARRLYSAFETANRLDPPELRMPILHPLAPVQPGSDAASPDQVVASRVSINTSTGECPRTKATLRLITLDSEQRDKLQRGLFSISREEFKSFNKLSDGEKAVLELEKFAHWLNHREGEPFTAIIDGPNVAYFMQNFDQGRFNFHQLKFLFDALEAKGENPLVILPFKYSKKSFFIHKHGSGPIKQFSSTKEGSILNDLYREGKLYLVPPSILDDYFWMLASTSDQTNARKGKSIFVEANNPDGRWPGARPMLISNDQMRDHKLELIEPRLFRRWYACHIVNYNFTGFVHDQCVDNEIGYSPADFFSREIQSNPTPLEGEEGSAGTAWHFPVEDWTGTERFVLRLPNRSK